jgi:ParB family chromosome partitioning protein
LSALIPERQPSAKKDEVAYVAPERVKPSALQPREEFEPQALEELAQSIREKGVIQPLLVRRRGDDYELIAGERRLRAGILAGLKEVPVIVRDVQDRDSLEMALIENIQRQELNPIEEARAFQYLIDKFHLTQEKIALTLGKARTTITNVLRLLSLPQEIQDELKRGRLSFAHGRALLETDDANLQRRLAQEAIVRGLSVRELESLLRRRRPRPPKRGMPVSGREPRIVVMEEGLQRALATKVRINKRKKRGHILIEFYSEEDLQRIAGMIERGASL